MLVKIGDTVFAPKPDTPITIYLDNNDKSALQIMPPESHYYTVSFGQDASSHDQRIKDFKDFVAEYESENPPRRYVSDGIGKYTPPKGYKFPVYGVDGDAV